VLPPALATLVGDVAELVWPSACPACDAVAPRGRVLCDACHADLLRLERSPCCRRCAAPLPNPDDPCGRCDDRGLRPFARVVRLGPFDAGLRELVHAVKYGRRWNLAEWLAARMAGRADVAVVLAETDVLVPVPLHWRRHVGRGFNQAEVVARWLARSAPHARVARAVARPRPTRSQTTFDSRAARARNVRDAFRLIDPDAVRGRRVLIVDDVLTTGATTRAVARVLRPARPASLSVAVLATADPRRNRLAAKPVA